MIEETDPHGAASTPSEWDLRDADLLGLHVDWRSGVTRIELTLADRPLVIVVRGTRAIRMPRTSPWGPSLKVDAVRRVVTGESAHVVVEMRSGDAIDVVGSGASLRAP